MLKKVRIDRTIKSKKILYYLLFFVFAAISTLTIAYAVLSTTLKITGSAEFEDASWNLVLEEWGYSVNEGEEIPPGMNIEGNTMLYGSGKLLKKPTLLGASITDFKVSLGKLGDAVLQNYYLINNGDIPARLESINYGDFDVISSTNNLEEIELVYDYFVSNAMLWECFPDEDNEEKLYCPHQVSEESILCPGATFGLQIINGYMPNAPRVPYEKITIDNLNIEFNFVAADQNLCNGSTPVTPNYNEDNG